MKVRELIKLLKSDGWRFSRQTGSHKIFKHLNKKGIVVVPEHGGEVPKGTLNSILRQAGLKEK